MTRFLLFILSKHRKLQ